MAALVAIAATCLGLAPVAFANPADERGSDRAGADKAWPQVAQTLDWTAGDSTTEYATVTTEAVAGPATIVFENSTATGNTSGMQHTLTFDTYTEGYNHDVDVDILAYPSDENGGRHSVDVMLTEGVYKFNCVIPGHGQMTGELVVTAGGGGGEDTTPPEATGSIDGETDANGDFIDSATVSLSATDDSSGVESIEYQIDDGSWATYSEPFDVTEIGDHTVGYRATDAAGNTSEPVVEPFTIVEGSAEDTTPPEPAIMLHGDTNADGAYLGSAEVMLSATDDGSGVASIEYQLDAGVWTTYTEPVQVSEVGDHTVDYRATDAAGNVSTTRQETFAVVEGAGDDDAAPQVAAMVSGTQNESWEYVGGATVTLSATDEGTGVESIEYMLDGSQWRAYVDPVSVESAGEHAVGFRGTDSAGNVSEPGRATFTVAAQGPAPTCAEPDPSPTVVVATIGTGVRNRVADGSCTIDDLIRDEARWSSHADFVTHVREVLAGLREDGIVSGSERTKILDAANRSDVGRNR